MAEKWGGRNQLVLNMLCLHVSLAEKAGNGIVLRGVAEDLLSSR